MQQSEYKIMYEQENRYWWYAGLHELIKFYVDKKTEIEKKELKIFDAGCGTGRMLELLSKNNDVSGIDFSAQAIEFAKKRGLKSVKVQDLNDWKAEPEKYDIIISSDVICSIGIKDDIKIIQKFAKSLKPGGLLILNLPAFESLRRNHDIAVHVAKRYRRNELLNSLKNKKLEIKTATYRLPALFFIILLKKKFQKKNQSKSDLNEIPKWINSILLKIIRAENFFIKKGFRFPLGSSLFIVLTNVSDTSKVSDRLDYNNLKLTNHD